MSYGQAYFRFNPAAAQQQRAQQQAQQQGGGGGGLNQLTSLLDGFLSKGGSSAGASGATAGGSGATSGGGFLGKLTSLFGGGAGSAGGATGATAASGASAGASAGASSSAGGLGSFSGAFMNPWMMIPAAAIAGATALSLDSKAAGTGSNEENWLGPLYNIPEAIARGNWDDAMKDGAWGPVGAVYGIASGKDPVKSIANSLGPLGQVPYLLFNGKLPFSGGKSSKSFMDAFQGRGL